MGAGHAESRRLVSAASLAQWIVILWAPTVLPSRGVEIPVPWVMEGRYDFDYTKGVSRTTTLSEIEAITDYVLHCYAFNHTLLRNVSPESPCYHSHDP